MALNVNQTVTDIVDAIATENGEVTGDARAAAIQKWTLIITALYNRIVADMDVLPNTLNNPVGQAVTIPVTANVGAPSAGATSAMQVIQGLGKVQ